MVRIKKKERSHLNVNQKAAGMPSMLTRTFGSFSNDRLRATPILQSDVFQQVIWAMSLPLEGMNTDKHQQQRKTNR